MLDALKKMINEAKKAVEIIEPSIDPIRLVSHYDADGITSAAIIARALLRADKKFHISFIKQLNEDFLKKLSEEKQKIIIFSDLGSGQLELIKRYLSGCKIIICDHHQPQGEFDCIHINSVKFGIEENVSGSGVAYILARTISPQNKDLSYLAIIGAIGDCQIDSIGIHWGLVGLNKEILKDAENSGKIKVGKGLRLWGRYTRPIHKALEYSVDPYLPGISGSESATIQFLQEIGIALKKGGGWRTIADLTDEEQKRLADGIIIERIRGKCENPEYIFGDVYEILSNPPEFKDANEFATILNACGKMGKAYIGFELCLNDKNAFSKVKDVLENYRLEIGKAVNLIYDMIEKNQIIEKNCIYIIAGNRISEHIISNVISIIKHSNILPDKPVFGFADAEDGVKISARISDNLAKSINLKDIVSKAAEYVGGVGGGHSRAAGATIPKGKEEMFINAVENIVKILGVDENGGKSNGERRGSYGEKIRTGESSKKVERKGLVQYFRS